LQQKLEEFQKQNAELKENLEKEMLEKEKLARQIDTMQEDVRGLGTIRDKYKEVQIENCKLYNMVQDLRGNIRVFCRVRPLGLTGDTCDRGVISDSESGTHISLQPCRSALDSRRKNCDFMWI